MVNARQFSRVVRSLGKVPSQITSGLAVDLSQEIQDNFDRGVDPYYRDWRPLAASTLARGRTPPPLTDTGRGRRSVVVRPAKGAGIQLTVGSSYMPYHQFGAPPRLPRRAFLPTRTLPPTWAEIWQSHLDARAAKVWRAGGGRVT